MLSPEQLNSINDFRTLRESSLRREYGWLALAGLFWLSEGDNSSGSTAENPIRLPSRAPAEVGVFTLVEGEVSVKSAKGVAMRINDKSLGGMAKLKPDTSGESDFVFIDDIRIGVIERGGQLAIRVWDPQNPVRLNFAGCKWFKPDEDWRVRAQVETYPEPKAVMIDDIVGIQREAKMHAALAFDVGSQTFRLDAEHLEDDTYDLIFKDSTAGKSTYGAGRYLTTEVAEEETVVIDFNKAYNPPCAFTEFATCPLPPPQNILQVAIEAGEKI